MSTTMSVRAAVIARRSIAVLAVPVGLIIGVTTMMVVASVTAQRTVATAAGAVGLIVATGSLAWWGLLGLRRRVGISTGMTATAVALMVVVVGAAVYAPAPTATAYPASSDIRYWDLPTGSRIAYAKTDADNPRPTPVILVHGGPGAPDRPAPEPAGALAAIGFEVYAYHQLGSGLSSRLADPSGYTVTRHVEDLEAIRSTLDADQVILIGASWGGQLIANYLAAHPDRVAKAVVSSPGTIWSPAYSDQQRLTEAARRDQAGVVDGHPRFMLAHMLMHMIGPRAASALLPDSTMDGIYEEVVADLDMRPDCAPMPGHDGDGSVAGFGFWANAATVLDSQSIPDPRPRLRQVTTPVLVLKGECDYLAWPVAREYRDLLAHAVLVPIDDAGHSLADDQPELFRQSIVAFLLDEALPLPAYQGSAPPW